MTAPLLALWAGLAASVPARQAPDSAQHARLLKAMSATFDAFDRLRGATHQFTLDLAHASDDMVVSRAARVKLECSRADSALMDIERILTGPPPTPDARREIGPTRAAATSLRAAFARCSREWGAEPRHPTQPDSLRAWGPYRTNQLELSLRRYAPRIQAFAHAAGADPKH
jgi:hypothetical protein